MDNTSESSKEDEKHNSSINEAPSNNGKPRMSFAEWKKSNGTASEPSKQRSHTKTNQIQQGNRGVQFNREPPPLMSLSVNQTNFGLPSSNNCNNNFNNFNNGNNNYNNNFNNNNFSNNYNNCNNNVNSNTNFSNNYNNNFNQSNPNMCKPLQPPPFWEDMFSPLRQPPMQRPLPRWQPENRETAGYHHRPRSSKPHARAKPLGNEKQANQTNESKPSDEAIAAAILMPPPPPPPEKTSNSNNAQKAPAKKHNYTQQGGWVQKPQPPPPIDEKDPGSKEERQRLWKEYRMAMKPFKNREFHNAKRCVQRLSKLPPSELDEKQTERLQKAMEYVAAHKAMLTVKHAERWVQKENPESEGSVAAQVYVRKPISSFWDNGNGQNTMQKHVPSAKQYIGTGRAIKGGPGAVVGSVYALPKPANNANFGYSHVTPGYVGEATVSYAGESDSQNYYSGYFTRGDTLMPSS